MSMVDFNNIKRAFERSGYFDSDVVLYAKSPGLDKVWSGRGRLGFKGGFRTSDGGAAGIDVDKPYLTLDSDSIPEPGQTARFVVTGKNGTKMICMPGNRVLSESGMSRWQVTINR